MCNYDCFDLVYKLYFIGGTVVSNEGDLMVFEIGSNSTLRWNLFGFKDGTSIYEIFYYKNNKKNLILSTSSRFSTENRILNYTLNNNPFEWNRISGYLNLNNGNGTLTINLLNVQYNESGVFSLEFESFASIRDSAKSNITLDVQSKFHSLRGSTMYFFFFVKFQS